MFNLIETTLNESTIKTVNARELWVFLGSKQDFSTWIKKRIADYGFVEGVDFVQNTFPQKNGTLESITYGRSKIEYYISLDMAKELSMVERNEKGQQARRYFIECERKLKEAKPALPQTYLEALKALVAVEEEKERLALENKEMAPKAEVYDDIVNRDNLYNAGQVIKLYGKSAKWLNVQLEQLDVYDRSIKRCRAFRQWFIDAGYGAVKETSNGFTQAMFTAKGQMWVIHTLKEKGLIKGGK